MAPKKKKGESAMLFNRHCVCRSLTFLDANSINTRLALVIKSGKVNLGYKSTLKSIRNGKAKLVLIAANTPPLRKSELEYYAMLSKTSVHHFSGNNVRDHSPQRLGRLDTSLGLRAYPEKKPHSFGFGGCPS
jgi:large subunit ribosomal protein L30e